MKIAALFLILIFALVGVSTTKAPLEESINDEDIKLVSFEDLAYPALAANTRLQGVVVVRAKLDADGNVVAGSAVSGSKFLIPDCLSNIKKWKFKPNPQRTVVVVYDFKIEEGACHDRSRSLFLLVHPNFASVTICSPVVGG